MSRSISRPRLVALVLALLLSALAVVAAPLHPERDAAAAATGAGFAGITPYGGYLGNYIAPDGTRVYCMDSGRDWPSGATGSGTVVGSLATQWGEGLSETTLRKLNYAMLTWGQTDDPTVAAAVSAYVYAYTSNVARTHGAGYAAGAHYINGNAAVTAAYDVVWNESETRFAGSAAASSSVRVELNGWDGSVRVSVNPASTRGTLSLEGAVVAGTRDHEIEVTDGSVVPIRAVVRDGEREASVRATARFTAKDGAEGSVVLYETGDQQRTIRGSFHTENSTSSHDSATSDVSFSPVVQTTVASRYVQPGEAFVDGLTVALAPGSAEWRTLENGEAMPVIAVGTLYGPFTQQPAVTDAPPEGVPVVGTSKLELTGTGEYRSVGDLTAPAPGYYTWVWAIDSRTQPDAMAAMLPADYRYVDQFGLIAESHVVPMTLSAVSQASVAETGFGGAISDELSISLDSGPWLTEAGVPIAARFIGTAYFVSGTQPPVETTEVPAEAVAVGEAEIVARAPGIYSTSQSVTAPDAEGYVTWVWRLDPSSPTAPYFEPWSDRFGIPAETTAVLPPSVSTIARKASVVGEETGDSAIVAGHLPVKPTTLVFRAYLQSPTAEAPLCDSTTLAFDSSDQPVVVTTAGTYDSPRVVFEQYGTYYWVETLYSESGDVIHNGTCGLPEETTIVSPAHIVTEASSGVRPGEPAFDTATVTGNVPEGSTIVFRAFDQTGIDDGPLCDASTLVFTSGAVQPKGAGTYRSESTRFERNGIYYWVETLYDEHGNPLHVGECGVPSETTHVQPGSLASTGLDSAPTLLIGCGLTIVGALALAQLQRSRRSGIRLGRARWGLGE
ncbi:hypothetical protein M2152_001304 [Microbacteriaceae bacterium SG_E_30_P1]|uniref:Uncharacterized protein n=1 Tax=Antiquaquibacter oligotrophicus TaxID=2880260 RepID=A0ABT6KPV0_9MICO|nr:hypothetical protein [Antiquaquibacter oligotrophicus]MDH6181122.1 hypothetical protein [Antiquaquibacter oligotrophicus]UDF13181.1 hypothetical protein LH407_13620 [Antiquaquibacter oligotrophicus]